MEEKYFNKLVRRVATGNLEPVAGVYITPEQYATLKKVVDTKLATVGASAVTPFKRNDYWYFLEQAKTRIKEEPKNV